MILVTGGTGMVGAHLLVKLLTNGKQVKAIYRSSEKLKQLQNSTLFANNKALFDSIEWVQADVRDVVALEAAFTNVTEVYHCAGFISFNPKDYRTLRVINIDGTANVVNLCVAYKVPKLCYVSSVATLGEANKDGVINEECHWNTEEDHQVYAITKYGAEMEVWRASQEGVKVVIVNPGVIFGTGVYSKSMEVFERVNKNMPFYTAGGSGFVGVEDVVNAMLYLTEKQLFNARYVVVADNMLYKDMLTAVAKALGKKPPHILISKKVLGYLQKADWVKGVFTGGSRTFTKHTVASANGVSLYSNAKIKDAGFSFEPIENVIERCAKAYV